MTASFVGRRILVVEDEMIVSWVLEDLLADLGCEIVGPAAYVDQALAMLESTSIEAAILDVNLDGQMSFPVADALASRGVPFAFTTGYRRDSLPIEYQDYPMLQKPYDGSALTEMMAQLLPPSEIGGPAV